MSIYTKVLLSQRAMALNMLMPDASKEYAKFASGPISAGSLPTEARTVAKNAALLEISKFSQAGLLRAGRPRRQGGSSTPRCRVRAQREGKPGVRLELPQEARNQRLTIPRLCIPFFIFFS